MFVHEYFDCDENVTRYETVKQCTKYRNDLVRIEFVWGLFGYFLKTSEQLERFTSKYLERGVDLDECHVRVLFSNGDLVLFEWHS